jgi:putative MATE family efflux protein
MTKNYSLTEGSVGRVLMRFALPFLLSSLFQVAYGAADVFIIGLFASPASISGVASGSSAMGLLTSLFIGLTSGATVLIGQYFGSKRYKDLTMGIASTIVLFAAFSALVTVLQILLGKTLLRLLNVPGEAFNEAWNFLFVTSLGTMFVMGYNVLSSILRGLGNSKAPMIFIAIACVVNIGLELLFVGVLRMAARGAAIATVISQFLSLAMAVLYIWKNGLPYEFSRSDIKISLRFIKNVFGVGIPIALQSILINISFMLITRITNGMGVFAAAGVGLVNRIIDSCMIIPFALSSAISALTAQNLGAGKVERTTKSMLLGSVFALAVALPFAAVCNIWPRQVVGLLTDDARVISQGALYLRPFSWDCVLVCFVFCMNGLFNGCGKTFFTMFHNIFTTFLIRIPVCWLMSLREDASLFEVGLGTPAATLVSLILCVIYYKITFRKDRLQNLKVLG